MNINKLCLSAVLSLYFVGHSYNQPALKRIITVTGKQVSTAQLDKIIQKTMNSLKIAGVSIAVINDARMVYHRNFGVKNVETKEPVNDSTLFEGASLSKPLFTYFLLKMLT